MSKKKISKKKNVLKVLWNECIPFKVLIFIIAYVVLAFINMPFEKWLTLFRMGKIKGLSRSIHGGDNIISNSPSHGDSCCCINLFYYL